MFKFVEKIDEFLPKIEFKYCECDSNIVGTDDKRFVTVGETIGKGVKKGPYRYVRILGSKFKHEESHAVCYCGDRQFFAPKSEVHEVSLKDLNVDRFVKIDEILSSERLEGDSSSDPEVAGGDDPKGVCAGVECIDVSRGEPEEVENSIDLNACESVNVVSDNVSIMPGGADISPSHEFNENSLINELFGDVASIDQDFPGTPTLFWDIDLDKYL